MVADPKNLAKELAMLDAEFPNIPSPVDLTKALGLPKLTVRIE